MTPDRIAREESCLDGCSWPWPIVTEVVGTVALQLSDGFRRLVPGRNRCRMLQPLLYLLAMTLRRLEIGVTYAVWAGVGTALVAIIGLVFLGEPVNGAKVVGGSS